MVTKYAEDEVDAWYLEAGLIPLTPYEGMGKHREATCTICGTWRRVTPKKVRDSVACDWCDGWVMLSAAGKAYRATASTWRDTQGPEVSAAKIAALNLLPLTPVGDEFTPVGCLCPTCGETLVVLPERIHVERLDWSGCVHCRTADKAALGAALAEVYEKVGLRLLERVRSRYSPKACECLRCGALRKVTYEDAEKGTLRACWSCLYGIDPEAPHRVYLFRFPALGVLKVGITHNLHDARLVAHQVQGGELLQSVVVANRATALAVESWVLATKRPWLRQSVGPSDFPQGGWTEAWAEADAPAVDLAEVCDLLGQLDP